MFLSSKLSVYMDLFILFQLWFSDLLYWGFEKEGHSCFSFQVTLASREYSPLHCWLFGWWVPCTKIRPSGFTLRRNHSGRRILGLENHTHGFTTLLDLFDLPLLTLDYRIYFFRK